MYRPLRPRKLHHHHKFHQVRRPVADKFSLALGSYLRHAVRYTSLRTGIDADFGRPGLWDHSKRTSAKSSGFLTPPPLVHNLTRLMVLKSRNLPYYVCLWANLPPPSVLTFFMNDPFFLCLERRPVVAAALEARRPSPSARASEILP